MIKLEVEITEEALEGLKKIAKKHFLTPEMEVTIVVSNYVASMAQKDESKLSFAEMLQLFGSALVTVCQAMKNRQKEE